MKQLQRAASIAAFLIVGVFLIHNLNALWLEPTYLGFEDKGKDYADMAKIENAIGSFSFMSSGIGHIVAGFSFMVLGLGVFQIFRSQTPIAAMFLLTSAMLAGLGFLLTGISDIPGTVYAALLRQANPDHNTTILLITTMIRGIVNIMAIAGLGWFAGTLSWCAQRTGSFPKGFVWFGYLNVLPGIMSLIFPPIGFAYIQLAPLWMLWLGLGLRKIPVVD
jgi:hypothetical protein